MRRSLGALVFLAAPAASGTTITAEQPAIAFAVHVERDGRAELERWTLDACAETLRVGARVHLDANDDIPVRIDGPRSRLARLSLEAAEADAASTVHLRRRGALLDLDGGLLARIELALELRLADRIALTGARLVALEAEGAHLLAPASFADPDTPLPWRAGVALRSEGAAIHGLAVPLALSPAAFADGEVVRVTLTSYDGARVHRRELTMRVRREAAAERWRAEEGLEIDWRREHGEWRAVVRARVEGPRASLRFGDHASPITAQFAVLR